MHTSRFELDLERLYCRTHLWIVLEGLRNVLASDLWKNINDNVHARPTRQDNDAHQRMRPQRALQQCRRKVAFRMRFGARRAFQFH